MTNRRKGIAMSKIVLINASCADQNVDAVVNAANDELWEGGGICGVIFEKAGSAACKQYRIIFKDGSAVTTREDAPFPKAPIETANALPICALVPAM